MTIDSSPQKNNNIEFLFLSQHEQKQKETPKAYTFHIVLKAQKLFLTNWINLLVCLLPFSYKWFNMLFLTLFILVASSFLLYVDPKCLLLPNDQEVICEQNAYVVFILHVCLHVIPFFVVLGWYGKHYTQPAHIIDMRFLNACLLLVLYAFFIPFHKMYYVRIVALFFLFFFSLFLYFLIVFLFL